MLKIPTVEKFKELKLNGIVQGLEEQLASTNYDDLSFEERMGLLADKEMTFRENRRLKTRLTQAKLRINACMEDIDYSVRRGIDKSLIQSLHTCDWLKDKLNIVVTGPTGVGKSFLCCAFAHRACLRGYKSRYFRSSKLFGELRLAAADGRYPKLMNTLAKTNLLVIDDWGLNELNNQSRNDLLDILEDRYGKHSTIIASQLPVEHWHKMIGNPTIADAILDRIVHNCYKINLKGESMRRKKTK